MKSNMCSICKNKEGIIGPTYGQKFFCANCYSQQSIRDLDISDKKKSYQELLDLLRNNNVPWKEITEHMKNWFPDWPTNGRKKLGISKVLSEKPKYAPAIFINRFNSWRNQFSNYGIRSGLPSIDYPNNLEDVLKIIFEKDPQTREIFFAHLSILANSVDLDLRDVIYEIKIKSLMGFEV
jgi:hypothetical protein